LQLTKWRKRASPGSPQKKARSNLFVVEPGRSRPAGSKGLDGQQRCLGAAALCLLTQKPQSSPPHDDLSCTTLESLRKQQGYDGGPRHALGQSTVSCVAVMTCTVVMSPSTMPNLSCNTLARRARQCQRRWRPQCRLSSSLCFVGHADHIYWNSVLRRNRNDHLIGSASDVEFGLLLCCEHSSGLAHVIGTFPPASVGWQAPSRGKRGTCCRWLPYQVLSTACLFGGNGVIESLVHAIILQLVDYVLQIHERSLTASTSTSASVFATTARKTKTADAAEAIDSHACRHGDSSLPVLCAQ